MLFSPKVLSLAVILVPPSLCRFSIILLLPECSPSLSQAHPRVSPILRPSSCRALLVTAAASAVILQEPGMDAGAAALEVRAPDAKAVVVVDPFSSGALLAKR